ncbi:glycosyltransferase family 4 protein [Pedobacter sp. MC2016-24]|uniref:glycosyltransferase family 4 protein n=1 Tax=Pedobacter sp. MC2016-24 TaxID=2780090 RepID=UPI001880D0BA|nr:glycosyltransferase family 4 protein [Pedobacter sp. MC2016-24]MBE9601666.1 glycosyltransferase family 4 protein [Pedobacter sp. MC2016-24]
MEKVSKRILISCDSPRSLLDFRGKLMERLLETHEVVLFTPVITQQAIRDKLVKMGVNIYENQLMPSTVNVISDFEYILTLYRLIKKIKPDVFFPYTFKPVIYGSLVANFCRVPCITSMLTGLGYNFTDERKNLLRTITKKLLKLSLKANRRRRLILQNQDDYKTLLKQKIITKANQVFIVNGSGVDLDYYCYSSPDITRISFLMISRLINAKGIKEYYEAAKLVKGQFPEVSFKLIGPYEENIDAIDPLLFEEIKTSGIIEYTGLIADVRPEITASSVVVLPSYYGEGIPRCILEAMAIGRAVITSDSVGCRETVNTLRKKANGFLVPVKNVPALVSKMEYYIKHPIDIIRFGSNGRKFAQDKFDVNKVNEQMVQIIEGR